MEVKNNTEYGEICRPGGFFLTSHALSLCSFKKGARLIDVGCGSGGTVRFLKANGFSAAGIEVNPEKFNKARLTCDSIFCGDAADLPFLTNEADGVLFECSFSKMKEPERVLKEAFRVLKIGGSLIITDFYARGEAFEFSGLLGRVEPLLNLGEMLSGAGLKETYFEDYSDLLPQMWGQLVMDYGLSALSEELGAPIATLGKAKCGYGLVIAKKGEMPWQPR